MTTTLEHDHPHADPAAGLGARTRHPAVPTAAAQPGAGRRGRCVKIRRTPEQFIDVTLQPIIFVLLFVYIFGGAISGSTHDYLQYVLPAIMVQTVLFTSLSIGVNLNTDIKKGVFDRFRSACPSAGRHRWSGPCSAKWSGSARR